MPDFGTARYRALFDVSSVVAGARTIRAEMASLDGAQAGFVGATSQGLQRLGGQMKQTGQSLTTGVTLPVIALGTKFVGTAKEIDSAWNEVRRVMNASPAEIEAMIKPTGLLGQATTEMSTRFGIAREEIIGVLGHLAAMGYDGPKAVDLMTKSVQYAIAGNVELEDGLNAVVGTAAAFKLEGQALQDTLYGLNRVENETLANAYDLSIGLSRASGAASTLVNESFSASDGVAAIAGAMATFKRRNIETARSANATRAIFQQLYATKPGTGDFWATMGVERADADGNLKPINELLVEMAANMDKLTQEERSNFFRKQIGIEFGPLLQLLLDDIKGADAGTSDFINTLGMMGETAQGQASFLRELDVQENSLAATTGRVGATWDLLVDQMTPLVRELLPPVLDFITRLITAFSNLSPEVQRFVVIGAAIAAVLGPLLIIFGAIVGAIGTLGAAFAGLAGPGSIIAGIAAAFAEGGLLGALGALGAALGPVLLVVGALVGAFVLVRDNWETLQPIFEKVFNTLKRLLIPAFKDIKRAIVSMMPILKILGAALIGSIVAGLIMVSLGLRAFAAVLKVVANIVGGFVNLVVGFFQWLFDVLVGNSIIPDLIAAFRYWFELGLSIITTIFGAIKSVFETIWNAIKAVVDVVLDAIGTAIGVYLTIWQTIIETGLGLISGVFSTVWNTISGIVSTVWGTITSVVETGINAVKSILDTVFGTIQTAWDGFWSGLGNGLSAVWETIKGLIRSGINGVIGIINTLIGGANSILKHLPGDLEIPKIPTVGSGTGGFSARARSMGAGFAYGGRVPGTGHGDVVPAMLTPGEFVIRKKAVQAIGLKRLEELNRVRLATGGLAVASLHGEGRNAVNRRRERFGDGGLVSDIGDFAEGIGGGIVGGVKAVGGFTSDVIGGAIDVAQDAAGAVKDVVEQIARHGALAVWNGVRKVAEAGLNALPIGNSTIAQMIKKTPLRIMDKIGDLIKGKEEESKQTGGSSLAGSTTGLNPEFLRRFNLYSSLVGGLRITSGFRSRAQQAALYDRWLRRVPGQAQAAPPGRSMHERGLAIDHSPHSTPGMRRVASRLLLRYPMSFEPWHVQPMNRGGEVASFGLGGLVGADGLGLLHKKEMVLPPRISGMIERMAASGGSGGGGGTHISVVAHNPVPEKPSETLYRAHQKLSVLGLIEARSGT